MAAVSIIIVVGLVLGGGLLLYALVQREHGQREATDWETGERMARRDTDDEQY